MLLISSAALEIVSMAEVFALSTSSTAVLPAFSTLSTAAFLEEVISCFAMFTTPSTYSFTPSPAVWILPTWVEASLCKDSITAFVAEFTVSLKPVTACNAASFAARVSSLAAATFSALFSALVAAVSALSVRAAIFSWVSFETWSASMIPSASDSISSISLISDLDSRVS